MKTTLDVLCAALCILLPLAAAQSSSSPRCGPSPSGSIRPSLASEGYTWQVVASGLNRPRGILLDGSGNLLVVEQGRGVVSAHVLNEDNGCVTVGASSDVTPSLNLNHGIELSDSGDLLYASSSNTVYSFRYSASNRTARDQTQVITNMAGSDHTTRTLLLSRKTPGFLVVSRGSTANLDFEAASLDSGHSQVKAFNLNNRTSQAYDYGSDGLLLGWGLRNGVGIAEHPNSGGIWEVENSADELTRMGVDIHQDNPAEELNFLGYLDRESAQQGGNFGYPWCFSAWDVDALPDNGNLSVGSQFAIDRNSATNNENRTDAYCAQQLSARLVFAAHMAPLDAKFWSNDGANFSMFTTFHGSWNRDEPVGYKLSVVDFTNDGEPVEPLTSTTAATDILVNEDLSRCPGNCFRPVGMAIDSTGRIFMSSDSSGEIYMVSRAASGSGQGSGAASVRPSLTPLITTVLCAGAILAMSF